MNLLNGTQRTQIIQMAADDFTLCHLRAIQILTLSLI